MIEVFEHLSEFSRSYFTCVNVLELHWHCNETRLIFFDIYLNYYMVNY